MPRRAQLGSRIFQLPLPRKRLARPRRVENRRIRRIGVPGLVNEALAALDQARSLLSQVLLLDGAVLRWGFAGGSERDRQPSKTGPPRHAPRFARSVGVGNSVEGQQGRKPRGPLHR
jgi:hypothetical protein